MGFADPVGKRSLVFGRREGRVWEWTGKERRVEARSGPVWEVPCRRIRVVLWVCGGVG